VLVDPNVLVTGGAGFIGTHLVRRLARLGASGWVFDDCSSSSAASLLAIPKTFAAVREDFLQAFENSEISPHVVFHLAARLSVDESFRSPEAYNDVNHLRVIDFAKLCRSRGVRRFVFASTAAVYGESSIGAVAETSRVAPMSPYAESKLGAENYLRSHLSTSGFEVVIARLFNVFGPGQSFRSDYSGVVTRFLTAATAGNSVTVFGDGNQTRDFVYVADVVSALSAMASLPVTQNVDVYNVGSGTATPINQLAQLVLEVTKSSAGVTHDPARRGDVRHSVADVRKLRSTGWQPVTSVRRGIEEIVGWQQGT
jgi:UDP-glucose 4-epimerase